MNHRAPSDEVLTVATHIQQEVADLAEKYWILDVASSGHDFSPTADTDVDVHEFRKEVSHYEALLSKEALRRILCPKLRSAQDEIKEIASLVSSALVSQIGTPQELVPLTAHAMALLCVAIMRVGVNAVCPGH